MKKIATWLFATVGGIVLLFSYKTSTEVVSAAAPPRADASAAATPEAVLGSPRAASAEQGAAPTGLQDGTYTGASQGTKYGPVQVVITVSGGQVTRATAMSFPTGTPRADEINADAIPRLETETVGTVDGQVDMVTGATFTSTGYRGSLQEAIDQARP